MCKKTQASKKKENEKKRVFHGKNDEGWTNTSTYFKLAHTTKTERE